MVCFTAHGKPIWQGCAFQKPDATSPIGLSSKSVLSLSRGVSLGGPGVPCYSVPQISEWDAGPPHLKFKKRPFDQTRQLVSEC